MDLKVLKEIKVWLAPVALMDLLVETELLDCLESLVHRVVQSKEILELKDLKDPKETKVNLVQRDCGDLKGTVLLVFRLLSTVPKVSKVTLE